MPDVGSLLIKAYEQRNLPKDKQDYDLMDKASHNFAAYICIDILRKILFKFYIYIFIVFEGIFNALKQLHRLATIDLYREALDTELIEARETSDAERKIKNILNLGLDDDGKANFNIIINVLTKIFMVFGKQPFIDQLSLDPLFSYINQI
ncbi:unnamed protein product [Rotaria sordida]|uniref:Uncharacterized protein n=1 Tax=Rotaria sordida TaxID=392033 RepID=A0A815VUD4_9BILA|nr:unnamed protein product [Rotaria sordida]CAF1532597.1 unnamed protein product [Rotaria sordida]